MHVPVHAVSQQKPSAQKPLSHWAAAQHACPMALLRVPSSVQAVPGLPPAPLPPFPPPPLLPWPPGLQAAPSAITSAAAAQIPTRLFPLFINVKVGANFTPPPWHGKAQTTGRFVPRTTENPPRPGSSRHPV